jgi:hypothetical protein
MDLNIARFSADTATLHADLVRAIEEVRTLRQEVQAATTKLSSVSWQIQLRDQSADFRAAAILIIIITFVLFAALWRGLGWI